MTSPPSRPQTAQGRGPRVDRRGWWLVAVVCATTLVVLALWAALARRHGPQGPASPHAAAPEEARKIHATLFYVSESGSELAPVSQEVLYGATSADQARRIVEAEMQGAPPGMSPAIPAGTTVRAVYLTSRGQAFVDLSREVVDHHTGGSLDEALTVFAIVDGLTVNLPEVTAVQILVDGKEVDTLVGHIDLRHPLGRSLKWVRKGQ